MTSEQAAARPRILAGQMIEGETAARMLHVSRDTVHRMWQKGIIRGRQMVPRGKWLYLSESILAFTAFADAGGTAEEYLDKLREELNSRERQKGATAAR